MSVFGVKAVALNLLKDWREAQKESSTYKSVLNASIRHWSPPPSGWIIVNIDATIFSDRSCIGLGSVIRNNVGQFMRARCKEMDGLTAPREAEALSLKEALSWTKELGFRNCIFETDAKLLADACKGAKGMSYFHTIVENCVEYCKYFDNVLVKYVSRSANEVTHMLGRAAHSTSDVQEWVNSAPEFVHDAIVFYSIKVMQVH
ncbi:uncharacterized protein LOC141691556 [Apium graveolens]|uniref:uncharacterized protein LOC141691556 n=1 Tax=Apium graveolens TaxID=4045 RepID=UPI003D797676